MAVCGIGSLVLGSISGCIINFILIFRNILCQKEKLNIKLKLIFIFILLCLGLYFNTVGIYGILTVLATSISTLFLGTDDLKLKYIMALSTFPWILHDFYIKSYPTLICNIIMIILSIITIVKIKKKE